MTTRDRIIVAVVAVAGVLAAFWFLALAPKRDEAHGLDTQIAQQQQALDQARRSAAQGAAAKARYDSDYAAITRLGKAVPVDDQVPSLIYQLQSSAQGAHVDFQSLTAKASDPTAPGATSGVAAVAAAGAAVKTNGASGASSAGSTGSSAPTATATQAAAAQLPPGAAVGSAGFPTMPFSFSFEGSFADMRHFLGNVQRLVRVRGKDVNVTGRLMTIDAFALSAGDTGFPQVRASLNATTYLLPSDQGLTDGASPQGPGQPGSTSTTAIVSGAK